MAVISPIAGTRTEPVDGYTFIKGTTAVFKVIFTSNGVPTKVDTGTDPFIKIFKPVFLNQTGIPSPEVIHTAIGTLVPGQEFEYQFEWSIPANTTPLDDYIVSYNGILGGVSLNFGDEYFAVSEGPGMIGLKRPAYATVNDIRQMKFNIDDYLPPSTRNDVTARNNLIEYHLQNATTKLREELNLHKSRGMSENYKLFCVYYTIWSILLSSKGEDGSSVSESNLLTYKNEWNNILAQLKRQSVMQGINLGRS